MCAYLHTLLCTISYSTLEKKKKKKHGESALHLAAKYDHPNVITTLAGTKMDVNMRGKVSRRTTLLNSDNICPVVFQQDENTALHIAAKLGNIESAKALISKGANPYLRNEVSV